MASDGDPLDNGVFETQTLSVGQADARLSITEEGGVILIDANTEKVAEELDADSRSDQRYLWATCKMIPIQLHNRYN